MTAICLGQTLALADLNDRHWSIAAETDDDLLLGCKSGPLQGRFGSMIDRPLFLDGNQMAGEGFRLFVGHFCFVTARASLQKLVWQARIVPLIYEGLEKVATPSVRSHPLEVAEAIDPAIGRVGEAYMTRPAVAAQSVASHLTARFVVTPDKAPFDTIRVSPQIERQYATGDLTIHQVGNLGREQAWI